MSHKNPVHKPLIPTPPPALRHSWSQYFIWGMLVLAALMAVAGVRLLSGSIHEVDSLTALGWGDWGVTIVRNKVFALWHGAVLLFIGVTALAWFLRTRSRPARGIRRWLPWALVALVAVDALGLSKHYLMPMPPSFIQDNAVFRYLKQNQGLQRVALASPEPFMSLWLTFAFPYHGIQIFDFSQGRRLPSDYSRLLAALDQVPHRLGQLYAVGYVLAPTEAVPEMNKLAGTSNAYEIATTYNIAETFEQGDGPRAPRHRTGARPACDLARQSARPAFCAIG